MSEKINIPQISQQRFIELWEETRTETNEDEHKIYKFFKPYIESIPRLTLGEYYWQIFSNSQPYPKILMADGAVNKLTPVDAKELVNSSVETFFSFYHPEDLTHVLTFLSTIFRIVIDEEKSKRKNYNITIYARIQNGNGQYVWNSIQYPALYFDANDNFLYGMALYTNINHLVKDNIEPMMTVLNSTETNNQKLVHYSLHNLEGKQNEYPNVSPREREIIALLSRGKSSKQIADILNLSKNTVDNHRQRLLKKFNVQSSSELVTKALLY
ncbi:MAG: helix-turn-helix domain-containing protein [Bacteroidetes bacterium]|nr:helix-turn-helix domain-containing protein [Bacteroidota bacterium]